MPYVSLTVSIRSENFATIRLGFPEPSIVIKRVQDFLVKITHAYIIHFDVGIMNMSMNNFISGSFPEYDDYKNLFPV